MHFSLRLNNVLETQKRVKHFSQEKICTNISYFDLWEFVSFGIYTNLVALLNFNDYWSNEPNITKILIKIHIQHIILIKLLIYPRMVIVWVGRQQGNRFTRTILMPFSVLPCK